MNLRRLPVLRVLIVRPRLLASIVLGFVVGFLLPESWIPHLVTRMLVAWNVAASVYLTLALVMMAGAKSAHIRLRAQAEDEGRHTVLALVIISSVLTLFATAFELSAAKDVHGLLKLGHVGLASLTVFSTWCVNQTMFALHYAHDYHSDKSKRNHGLCFPATRFPTISISYTPPPSSARPAKPRT